MSEQETLKILTVLRAAYPMFYRGLKDGDAKAVVNLWQIQFAEDSYKDVSLAVHTLISTRTDTFPPVIGEIKEVLRSITHPDEIPSGDAWDMVMKCIKRGGYHAAEDWANLPAEVRVAVSVDEIKRHAENEDFNEGVEKSLFLKRWAVMRDKRKTEQQMPPSLRAQIEARRTALETAQPPQITAEPAEPIQKPAEPVQKPAEATKYESLDIRAYLSGKRS
jgi:hypothetical protein